jgi:hypothetical protein
MPHAQVSTTMRYENAYMMESARLQMVLPAEVQKAEASDAPLSVGLVGFFLVIL